MPSNVVGRVMHAIFGTRGGRFDVASLVTGTVVALPAAGGGWLEEAPARVTGLALLFAVAAQVLAAPLKRGPLQDRLVAEGTPADGKRKSLVAPTFGSVGGTLLLVAIMHWVIMSMALGEGISNALPELVPVWHWAKGPGALRFLTLLFLILASSIPTMLVWRAFLPRKGLAADLLETPTRPARARELAADALVFASVQILFATIFSDAALHANTRPMGIPDGPVEWLLVLGFAVPLFTVAHVLIYVPPRILLLAEDLAQGRGGWTAILAVQPWVISYIV